MGINIEYVVKDVLQHIERDVAEALEDGGTLDPEQVEVQFHTQGDDRVRPSHAALDGLIGAPGDPDFPSPPLDYGCRCYLTYHGKEGTPGAAFLPLATKRVASEDTAEAYATALDEKLPGWEKLKAKIQDLPPFLATGKATLFVRAALPELTSSDVTEMVRMVMQAKIDD